MRVTDYMLQGSLLYNLTSTKAKLSKIQEQVVTQSKVNRPSDNPLANSRIMKLNSQISSIQTYQSNIDKGTTKVDSSVTSMEAIHTEIQKIITKLTSAKNATIETSIEAMGEEIELALSTIVDQANAEFDGEYLFAGTNNSSQPFSFNSDGTIKVNSTDIGGDQKIRLTGNILQKINMNGRDLFQSVLDLGGNLDSTGAVGASQSTTETIWDTDGNEYTANITYTKTAANTYDMGISITDSTSTVIYNDTKADLVFNSTTGKLESIDGSDPADIAIQIPAKNIDFILNTDNVIEDASASTLRSDLSQNANIFNTLFSIKEKMLNGELPNDEQLAIIEKFESHILNKISEMGNITNRLTDTQEMLDTQELDLETLLSSERDIDEAQAIIDMENYDYSLQMAYKAAAMILPQSLLDYL